MNQQSLASRYESVFIGAVLTQTFKHDCIDLNPADFQDNYLSAIWSECQKMKEIDLTSLAHKFDEKYLAGLISSVPSSTPLEKYARKIKGQAYRRRLSLALATASKMAVDGNLHDVANFVVSSLDSHDGGKESEKLGDILAETYHDLQAAHETGENINFTPSGMPLFDSKIGGLQKEGLIIVAGRPSMGKSAYAACLAMNAGKTGKVLMISLEMSRKQLAMRFLAAASSVDMQSMMQGKLNAGEWTALANSFSAISDHGIWINDITNRSVQSIKAEARRFKRRQKGVDLIVIDYLTLLDMPKSASKADAVGDISREMKVLAGELGCPVVLLSQLNRSLESRNDKRPMMSDLRDSGAIEQDADQIIFPYRPEVYDKKPENEGIADIIVAKNRNGRTGVVRMAWLGKAATFKELERESF